MKNKQNETKRERFIRMAEARTIKIISMTLCAFRLNVEYITDAYRSLNGNGTGKVVVWLCSPAMSVQ